MKKCSPVSGLTRNSTVPAFSYCRRARELHGVGQDALAQALVEIGRRRHLDDLLVAQLHRAVALEQVHDVALAVAQHLDLDVPRPRHDLLQEEGAIAERGLGLALAAREGLVHLLRPGHGAHAAPAAAGRGFQHHRIADGLGLCLGLVARGELGRAGNDRNALRLGEVAGRDLVAEQFQAGGRGADEAQSLGLAALGEEGVLRQEAVAGMDAIAAACLGRGDDRLDVEIAAHRIAADLARRARELGVQRQRIGPREDRDRIDAQRRRGPGNADRDLPAIGDQDALEHCSFLKSSGPRASRAPAVRKIMTVCRRAWPCR